MQRKIHSLLISYFLPSFAKKLRRSKKRCEFKNVYNSLNPDDPLTKCHLLAVKERRDLYLFKYAFCNLKPLQSTTSGQRSWPLLVVPRVRTTLALNNITYRATKLWNTVPRSWDFNITYLKFFKLCRDFLSHE